MNMKKLIGLVGFLLLITTLYSCSPQVGETSSETELVRPLPAPATEPSSTLNPDTETANPDPARFTIIAATEFQGPVSDLYQAFFDGEAPDFVDNDGELLIKRADALGTERPSIQATYLPETIMVPQVEKADVQNFVNFAISVEGQRLLIENGYLDSNISLTDQAGNDIELIQPINSVLSTYGPATSFIYSVGAEDRLVSANYLGARDPLGAAVMEKIDPRFPGILGEAYFSQQEFNVEQAASLDPDLIVTSARTAWLDAAEQLGLQAFLFDAETPEQLKEAMQLTGQLFGPHATAQAEAWGVYYEFVFNTILEQTKTLNEEDLPRVLFTGTDPLRVASGEMYQTDIIQAAGGVSVTLDLAGYWNNVNLEQIAIWDPDVIIVPPYGGASIEAITDSTEWQILEAVQAGRVYQMPKLVVPWDTPAPDSVLGIVWLAQRLHPELVTLGCPAEADYFYNTFYNYSITDEEIATICQFD
jgi:iron complex transport system substrate-binding protein